MLRRQTSGGDKGLQLPPPLQPPEGYYVVDDGLYRAASVQPASFAFLDNLKLRSVMVLSGVKPDHNLKEYLNSSGVEQIRFFEEHEVYAPTMRYSETEELIKLALETVIDANNLPMMLVGGPIAGHFDVLVVGVLRRLLNWSLSAILSEIRLLTGRTLTDLEQFVEHCDISLIQLPRQLPAFLEAYLMLEAEEFPLFQEERETTANVDAKQQKLRKLLSYKTGAVISEDVTYNPSLSLVTGEDDA